MSTVRIQVRRGTASDWSTVNPILAAGEMGYETDTNKFKFGNGTGAWDTLTYAASDTPGITEIAQDAINAALSVGSGLTKTYNDGANTVTVAIDDTVWATKSYVDGVATDLGNTADNTYIAQADRGAVNGVASLNSSGLVPDDQINTNVMATKTFVSNSIADVIDTAPEALNTLNELAAALGDDANYAATVTQSLTDLGDGLSTLTDSLTSNTESLNDRIDLTEADISQAQTNITDLQTATTDLGASLSTHASDTTDIHGIADTANLATKAYVAGELLTVETTLEDSLSAHVTDTTNVHGIEDTADLATKTYADTAASTAAAGVTASSIGLANVDNTADADKPVSTATQTALDLKADLDDPTFTGTVNVEDLVLSGNLTVNGTTTTVNATDLSISDPLIYIGTGNSANANDLGLVGHFDNGTYQHTGIARDASDGKWKLFSGIVAEPEGTIDFSTWTKDTLVMGALEATSATIGDVSNTEIQYLDGVTSAIQTQIDGKSSILSTMSSQSADYTITSANIDNYIEVSSAATITVPASATWWPIGGAVNIIQTGSGQAVVAGAGGTTVNGTPGLKLRAQWSGASIVKRSTDTFVVLGDLKA